MHNTFPYRSPAFSYRQPAPMHGDCHQYSILGVDTQPACFQQQLPSNAGQKCWRSMCWASSSEQAHTVLRLNTLWASSALLCVMCCPVLPLRTQQSKELSYQAKPADVADDHVKLMHQPPAGSVRNASCTDASVAQRRCMAAARMVLPAWTCWP